MFNTNMQRTPSYLQTSQTVLHSSQLDARRCTGPTRRQRDGNAAKRGMHTARSEGVGRFGKRSHGPRRGAPWPASQRVL